MSEYHPLLSRIKGTSASSIVFSKTGRFFQEDRNLDKAEVRKIILISSKAIIVRPLEKKFDTSRVIRADTLRTKIDEEVDKGNPLKDMTLIAKLCTSATLKETAKRLASFHTPKETRFKEKVRLIGAVSRESQ